MKEIDRLPAVPSRAPEDHKGRFGHVLVLAGSPRMTGAALLTARAAARAGAGLVTLGVPHAVHALIAPAVLEGMTLPLPCTTDGVFSEDATLPTLDFANDVAAAALGPGIGTEEETVLFVSRVAQRARPPMVVDADGLNCLAKSANVLRAAAGPRVITPHPGEAARLLGTTAAAVQTDRRAAVQALAEKFACVALLKGHRTLITDGESLYENPTGNPGMATGGAGDVLTGVVAGLLAQGLSPLDAAVLGAHAHGLAGDLAARRMGMTALIAGDILDHLGEAWLALERR